MIISALEDAVGELGFNAFCTVFSPASNLFHLSANDVAICASSFPSCKAEILSFPTENPWAVF